MSEDVRNRGQKVAGATGPKATDPASFEVRRYDDAMGNRESVGGLLLREVAVVSLRTDRLGTYALVARPLRGVKGAAL